MQAPPAMYMGGTTEKPYDPYYNSNNAQAQVPPSMYMGGNTEKPYDPYNPGYGNNAYNNRYTNNNSPYNNNQYNNNPYNNNNNPNNGNPNNGFNGVPPGGVPPPGVGQNLQPVPVSQLGIARAKLEIPQLRTDNNNQLKIETRPGWIMKCFMCPFPFFCLGCCLSQSTNLLFDDRKRTVSLKTWNGYCFCCVKDRAEIPYEQVANFIAVPSNMRINHQTCYNINLVTKSGERIRISDPDLPHALALDLLAYHRFMFGRANPETYVQPSFSSLIVFV